MRTSPTNRATLPLIVVLLAAPVGCAAQPPGVAPSEPGSAAPTRTAEPTPVPTRVPTRDEALHAYLSDRRLFLYGTFTGTSASASHEGELSGTYVARGDDFSLTTSSTVWVSVELSEQRNVDGQGFERHDDGRWYATENIYIGGSLASLIDGATWSDEIRPGWFAPREIDLLALASTIGALPANLTVPDAHEIDGAVAAGISERGELTALEVDLVITTALPISGEETSDEWSLAFTFEADRKPVRITAPAEAWRREVLGAVALVELPFTFERAEVEDSSWHTFWGPEGETIGFAAGPADGLTPAENYDAFVSYLASADGLGSSMEVDEPFRMGQTAIRVGEDSAAAKAQPPVEGRLVATHTMREGEELYYAAAIVQPRNQVYVIHWMVFVDGTEHEQLERFKQILASFVPFQ